MFGTCPGSFAEYATARDDRIALKPGNSTFEEAATIPVAGLTALQGLRDAGQIKPGQKVLIDGASGGVGTFAVLLAKAFGAEVTTVCSTQNIEQARSIGADYVVDYTREDFTRNGQQYDLVFGVNGYHSIFAYKRALTPTGIFVMAGSSRKYVFQALIQVALLGPLLSRTGGQKLGFMGITKINQDDLGAMKDLLETRKVVPVIDKRFRLIETADAFRYFGEGHVHAKVVIGME